MDYSELIENLKNLETIAYGYNINGEVFGMDCSDFEQIMVDAADAIAELNQYKELGSLDRLRELVQADREGRCAVLPCKVGDPVYMATGRSRITGYEEDICDGFFIDRTGKLQIKAQNYTGNHGTYGSLEDGSVQLTRESAEKALEEMEGNGNG